ncbi:SDR family oxidoreductase [Rathayibacter sp. YIM 133350]|uniref:SDR family oxidoreductase n=1 Tax=Rathayibacter sp. YIM 133350 TaxID=3131992 RepID=UPI00307EB44D
MSREASAPLAVVTGATGYVGGRLVPRLLAAGLRVRVVTRSAERLRDAPWISQVEVVAGDLGRRDVVERAVADADVLYYLVHSMAARGDFERREREIALLVAEECARSGVGRIVFLGGLHPETGELSRHLRSRTEVARILLAWGVPTLVLQAGVIIGSGSTSFEMIRHLTEVLPYMPAPRWVRNRIQPIAIRDVLYYLVQAAQLPSAVTAAVDIGGPDVLRYGQLMNGYALEAGLRQRAIAALPVLTPWLASQWVNLVTPIPRRLAVPIIESLQFDCVMRDHAIDAIIPPPSEGLVGYRRAVRLALAKEKAGDVETSWRDGVVEGAPSDPLPSDPDWAGVTVYTDVRSRRTAAPVENLWSVIEGVGGENGWYSLPPAWALRGWLDKLVGGVGLSRGRRDARRLKTGDALDFWRVERIERPRLLRLRAEMRLPGLAWLEMTAAPEPDGGAAYGQRAVYFPRGLLGRLYWWTIWPFHGVIFAGMARRITASAERLATAAPPDALAHPSSAGEDGYDPGGH